MTTINQKKLALARSIAVKLVVSGGMLETASFAPRTLSVPFDTGVNHLMQIIPPEVFLLSYFPLHTSSCLFSWHQIGGSLDWHLALIGQHGTIPQYRLQWLLFCVSAL